MKSDRFKARVLMLVDNSLCSVGGAQESTKLLINSNLKYEFHVASPSMGGCGDTEYKQHSLFKGLQLRKALRNPFNIVIVLFRIGLIVRRVRPQIIHCQSQILLILLSCLVRVGLVNSSTFLLHTERGFYKKYNSILKYLMAWGMRSMNDIICTTKTNARLWSTYMKICEDAIIVIPNAVSDVFIWTEGDSRQSRPYDISIGFAGRYCDWKNWPLAEEIVSVLNKDSKYSFSIDMAIGVMSKGERDQVEELFSRMSKLIGDRFNGSINLDSNGMRNFYRGLDVFILTSEPGAESFGRTAIEAMGGGAVVLSTRGGGTEEVIGNRNLLFTTAQDSQKILASLIEDSDLKQEIRKNNLRRVKELYSIESYVSSHERIYSGALERVEE